jgi:uridylate kinase
MKVAIKVGGSVFCPAGKPDMGFVRSIAAVLKDLSENNAITVVVGGGALARRMIAEARGKGVTSEGELHDIGIEASRKNAQALIGELGEAAFNGIPRNEEEVKKATESGKIVVLGGFRPGQTTDAVTLQSAEAIGADLVIIGTDVKGVYTKDPKKHDDAVFISEIPPGELLDMVETGSVKPGAKTIVDPVAVRIIMKTGIKAVVADIRDTGNLRKVIEGVGFEGTVIG